jgi:hypothetical protein
MSKYFLLTALLLTSLINTCVSAMEEEPRFWSLKPNHQELSQNPFKACDFSKSECVQIIYSSILDDVLSGKQDTFEIKNKCIKFTNISGSWPDLCAQDNSGEKGWTLWCEPLPDNTGWFWEDNQNGIHFRFEIHEVKK